MPLLDLHNNHGSSNGAFTNKHTSPRAPKTKNNTRHTSGQALSSSSFSPSFAPTRRTYDVNARVVRTGMADLSVIHRCVPPKSQTSFVEDTTSCPSPYCSSVGRKYHVYAGSSVDYASRLNSRQSAPPKVVGFDGKTVAGRRKVPPRGINGFFPPVKLRNSTDSPTASVKSCPSQTSLSPRVSFICVIHTPTFTYLVYTIRIARDVSLLTSVFQTVAESFRMKKYQIFLYFQV